MPNIEVHVLIPSPIRRSVLDSYRATLNTEKRIVRTVREVTSFDPRDNFEYQMVMPSGTIVPIVYKPNVKYYVIKPEV